MSVPGSLVRTHSANSNMGIKDTRTRRRSRSTSIIHEVLPETVVDESDQSALPNWNSSWVNLKGKPTLPKSIALLSLLLHVRVSEYLVCILMMCRCLAYPPGHDHCLESPLQLVARSVTGIILDTDKSHIHGFELSHVSLGQGDSFRVQCWCIR